MKIYRCARCEGCGYVAGAFRWEFPWTRWAPDPEDPQHESGVLEPHPCPDCIATGALLQLDGDQPFEPALPTRRGMPRQVTYAQHVAAILQGWQGRGQH
jgi:hypothetical protein